jgi:hypothetical protein
MRFGDTLGNTSMAKSKGTNATQPKKLISKLGIEAAMSIPEAAETPNPIK